MKNSLYKKGVVFGIIILFLGAGVVPVISGNVGKVSNNSVSKNAEMLSVLDESGWQWAKSAGGTNYDIRYGVAVDASGNTYITGHFKGTATFGSITLTSQGNNDVFVTKLLENQPPSAEISVDIKPGSYSNSINPKSKGKVPVAILTTDVFDASMVESDTVFFLGATPVQWALEDVDDDGDIDMILHFKTQELDFSLLVDEGDDYPYAYLTGETTDGTPTEGKDTVRLVGPLYELLEQLFARFPILEPLLQPFFNVL